GGSRRDAASTLARLARRDDLLPRPLTGAARVRGHHGPEDAPAHVLHLTGATAGMAPLRCGPRPSAAPVTDVARLHASDLDLAPRAERRLLDPEREIGEQVLAWLRPA